MKRIIKSMLIILTATGLVLGAGLGLSRLAANGSCKEKKDFGIFRISERMIGGECKLLAGLNLMKRPERYRSFTFSPNGQVMMFAGTNDSEYMSRATGARCFHLLPFQEDRGQASFKKKWGGKIAAVLPSGHRAVFSPETGNPTSIEGYSINFSPLAHIKQIEKNKGFMDIQPEKGSLLFDYGWRTGEVPMSQMWRSINILDGNGNTCVAKMSDVFKVDPQDRDEVIFLHDTNEKLAAFLKRKCPGIVMPD